MKSYNIALKNIKENLYRYIMYYLSNTFTVAIFFIFSNFMVYSKKITNIQGVSISIKNNIDIGIILCQIIIVMFSIIFVTYSISIFLRYREKEFGLLSLFGMSINQIRKYVLIESMIISVASITSGIILGILFSKLFFLIIGAFLKSSIAFGISFKATILTFILFFILFEVINVIMFLKIKNKEIIEQIKLNKTSKEVPTFSIIKSLIGIVLIIAGYAVSWITRLNNISLQIALTTFMVIVGTYFIITEFSIAIINGLKKNTKRFYRKTSMITISQIMFKLKDTAKILFLTSILGTVTFTATETIYSFFTETPMMTVEHYSDDIGILQTDKNIRDHIDIEDIKSVLKDYNVNIKYFNKIEGIKADEIFGNDKNNKYMSKFMLVSNSQYNKIAKRIGEKKLKINKKEMICIFYFDDNIKFYDNNKLLESKVMNDNSILKINDKTQNYIIKKKIYKSPIYMRHMLVINDKEFKDIIINTPQNKLVNYYSIKLNNWLDSYEGSRELEKFMGVNYRDCYHAKIYSYTEQKNTLGMMLFIGLFIVILFSIASGSIIYFRLFNDIKQDSVEFGILKKIGASQSDIKKIITKQIAVIFFIPFIVSTIHSLFALKLLENIFEKNLLINGLTVMVGYLIFQLIYFLLVRKIYIRKINALK